MGCKQLKKVSFDPGMTLGSRQAFAGCTSLTTVPVLNCVDGYRFKHCSSLTTVTLKQAQGKMHSFVDRAFINCTSLKVVILDISESDLPDTYCITHAFEGCNDRMEIKFVDQKRLGEIETHA